jgi:hypothetical protein
MCRMNEHKMNVSINVRLMIGEEEEEEEERMDK